MSDPNVKLLFSLTLNQVKAYTFTMKWTKITRVLLGSMVLVYKIIILMAVVSHLEWFKGPGFLNTNLSSTFPSEMPNMYSNSRRWSSERRFTSYSSFSGLGTPEKWFQIFYFSILKGICGSGSGICCIFYPWIWDPG